METIQKNPTWTWKYLGDVMNEADQVQNERIAKVEERMLMLEQAILEMRGMAKTIKLVVIALAASFGLDVHGMLL